MVAIKSIPSKIRNKMLEFGTEFAPFPSPGSRAQIVIFCLAVPQR